MSESRSAPRVAAPRAPTRKRDAWHPTGPQLVLTGLLLALVWGVVFIGLGEVFAPGSWTVKSVTVSAATILVTYLLHAARSGMRISSVLVGAGVGLACWLWMFTLSSAFDGWLRAPIDMFGKVEYSLLAGSAPLDADPPLTDVIVFGAWILAMLTVLIGLWRPLAAATFAALFLLVPSAVTGISVGGGTLLAAGMLLAFVVWVGSPTPRLGGIVAAGAAVAVAAGAFLAAPLSPNRVWNESLHAGPVADGVPDVTVALANDLREGSENPVFSFKNARPGPTHFTLATLASFEGGHWYPQSARDKDALTVSDPRSETSPAPASGYPDRAANMFVTEVTVTIDGLLSTWLPLPKGTVRVNEGPQSGSFDPRRWQWTADSNTARALGTITRRGDRYTAMVFDLTSSAFVTANPADMRRFPDPADAPKALLPYLELPDGLPDTIAQFADQIAGDAPDRLSAGLALESWFRGGGGFSYDEAAPYEPGMDRNDPYAVMSAFLDTRQGFCVHFASTFAVMARHLGVPTRVAIGYAAAWPGTGTTSVRSKELHAWPEIYVDGTGWVAFEPTPGGAWVRADTGVDVPSTPTDETDESATQPTLADPQLGQQQLEDVGAVDKGAATNARSSGRLAMWWSVSLGALLLVLLASLVPALIRALRTRMRRRRIAAGSGGAAEAWAEFLDALVDLGAIDDTAQGGSAAPRARTAEALVEHLSTGRRLSGEGAEAAEALAAAMVRERYGAPGPVGSVASRGGAPGAGALLDTLLRDLRSRASRRERLRAAFWPRSVLGSLKLFPRRRTVGAARM